MWGCVSPLFTTAEWFFDAEIHRVRSIRILCRWISHLFDENRFASARKEVETDARLVAHPISLSSILYIYSVVQNLKFFFSLSLLCVCPKQQQQQKRRKTLTDLFFLQLSLVVVVSFCLGWRVLRRHVGSQERTNLWNAYGWGCYYAKWGKPIIFSS